MLAVLGQGWGCLTETPGEKDGNGPRPKWHRATHSCKTCFHFLSLEPSITCNSLKVIYIETIKYDLRYKLTSTRPHIT